MAITAYSGDIFTKAQQDVYVPELWSDMVLRYIHEKTIVSNLCFDASKWWSGSKQDNVHVPWVGRFGVNPWIENSPVQLQTMTDTEFTFAMNRAMECSFSISDLSRVYTDYDVFKIYMDEQALVKLEDIENFLLSQRAGIHYVSGQIIYNTNDGTATGTKLALGLAGVQAASEILTTNKVPTQDRFALVSPGQAMDILAIATATSRDYVVGEPLMNGQILKNWMGFNWYVSSLVTSNTTTGFTNGTNGVASPTPGVTGAMYLPTQGNYTALPTTGGGSGNFTTALFGHPQWCAFASGYDHVEQARLPLHLSDASIMAWIFDARTMRTTHAVVVHTAS